MKITVVGAILIAAGVIVAFLVIRAVAESQNRRSQQNDSQRPIQ